MQNLVADAVDDVLSECERLLAENERLQAEVRWLRLLVDQQEQQIVKWRSATVVVFQALERLNNAVGPVVTHVERYRGGDYGNHL
jgi:hypothetical protein